MLPNNQPKLNLAILLIAAALCMAAVGYAAPMGTGFTFQGRLTEANSPAEGLYDFEFELYDDATADSQKGGTIDVDDVDVVDGYFTVHLDFGDDPNIFNGDARWLEIAVRPGELEDPNTYTSLSPRHELTPAPYALYALSGNQGPIGPEGSQGVKGDTGDTGSQGLQGVKGDTGDTGPQGIQGPIGLTGDKGDTGDTGPQGIQGPAGDSHWQISKSNTYYDVGNVGIGTTDPDEKLEVGGNIKISGTGKGLIFPDGTVQTTSADALSALIASLEARIAALENPPGWGTAELIETDNAGNAVNPQVAADGSGNAVAVWHQHDGTRYNIWSNRYVAGTGWGTAELMETGNVGSAVNSQVAAGGSGNTVAVWQKHDGTRYNI